jgi:secondary thiamine-phosphate synthase enzyme
MTELSVRTGARQEMIDITDRVGEALRQQGAREGMCHVFILHTTAGLTMNENWDPLVQKDIVSMLESAFPSGAPQRHSEGNSPAHLKASLVGSSVLVPVRDGKLVLGQWQGIYLCEFDGPRTRRFIVQMVGQTA